MMKRTFNIYSLEEVLEEIAQWAVEEEDCICPEEWEVILSEKAQEYLDAMHADMDNCTDEVDYDEIDKFIVSVGEPFTKVKEEYYGLLDLDSWYYYFGD